MPNITINNVKMVAFPEEAGSVCELNTHTRSTLVGYQENQLSKILWSLDTMPELHVSQSENISLSWKMRMGACYDIAASCTKSYHTARKMYQCKEQMSNRCNCLKA